MVDQSIRSLQAALLKREAVTKHVLVALAEAERVLSDSIQEHKVLEKDLSVSLLRREGILSQTEISSSIDLQSARLEDDFILGLRLQIIRAIHRVSVRKKKRDQTRLAYLEAKKNQSVLEKVIEKKKAAVRAEQEQAENRSLDDIYSALGFHRVSKRVSL